MYQVGFTGIWKSLLSCIVWNYSNREIVAILYCAGFQEQGHRCYLVMFGIAEIGKSLLSRTVWDCRNREIVAILYCMGLQDQANRRYLWFNPKNSQCLPVHFFLPVFLHNYLGKKKYNVYNEWNTKKGCMHLNCPPNSLSAEIQLAGDATIVSLKKFPMCCGSNSIGKPNKLSIPDQTLDK